MQHQQPTHICYTDAMRESNEDYSGHGRVLLSSRWGNAAACAVTWFMECFTAPVLSLVNKASSPDNEFCTFLIYFVVKCLAIFKNSYIVYSCRACYSLELLYQPMCQSDITSTHFPSSTCMWCYIILCKLAWQKGSSVIRKLVFLIFLVSQ